MSTLDRLQRMDYLVDLIQRKATGNVDQLAEKLNVSRRTVHNLIDVLKGMDAPIAWDPVRGTYYFEEEGHFIFRFKKKPGEE